jgi:hypothetical protein
MIFIDMGQIDPWARESMTLFVKAGVISKNRWLMPEGDITRAGIAEVLYDTLNRLLL